MPRHGDKKRQNPRGDILPLSSSGQFISRADSICMLIHAIYPRRSLLADSELKSDVSRYLYRAPFKFQFTRHHRKKPKPACERAEERRAREGYTEGIKGSSDARFQSTDGEGKASRGD